MPKLRQVKIHAINLMELKNYDWIYGSTVQYPFETKTNKSATDSNWHIGALRWSNPTDAPQLVSSKVEAIRSYGMCKDTRFAQRH